ncbi:MAG: AraC family transcriptional regulator [Cyanobacteria bacterium J06639_1]
MSDRDALEIPTLTFVTKPDEPLQVEVHHLTPAHPIASLGVHRHRFFELVYIERGNGTHQFGRKQVATEAGDLFAISPNDVHDSQGLAGCHGWMIVFKAEALGLSDVSPLVNLPEELLLISFLRPCDVDVGHFHLPAASQRVWSERCRTLAGELDLKQLGYVEAVQSLLRLMLVDTARLASKQLEGISAQSRPLLGQVFRVIDARFDEPISLADVAETVGRSKSYLTSLVRRETGRTVLGWILERRLREAKRLLGQTDLSVETVAETVGFNNPAYFIRQFRKSNGVTPHSWRQELR